MGIDDGGQGDTETGWGCADAEAVHGDAARVGSVSRETLLA